MNDSIHIIRLDGLLLAKRIQHDMEGNIHIKSDNPLYSEQVLTIEKAEKLLHVVGKVVNVLKKI